LIGLWASNPSVGDIIGQQLYLLMTRNNQTDHWGYTFMTLGGLVLVFGFLNLFFLVEFPNAKGISIKEEGQMMNPSQLKDEKKMA